MTLPIKGKFVSDRGIANIFLRPDDKMCSYGAWHYLLSQAAFKDHQTNYKGHIITIKRGDFPTTYRKLAEIFNWSVGRVRRFIKNAEVAGHVITSVDTGFLIITLCDYSDYNLSYFLYYWKSKDLAQYKQIYINSSNICKFTFLFSRLHFALSR